MALAFCHAHEITLRDLEMYGVLQVGTPVQECLACSQSLERSLLSKAEDSDVLSASHTAAKGVHSLILLDSWQLERLRLRAHTGAAHLPKVILGLLHAKWRCLAG